MNGKMSYFEAVILAKETGRPVQEIVKENNITFLDDLSEDTGEVQNDYIKKARCLKLIDLFGYRYQDCNFENYVIEKDCQKSVVDKCKSLSQQMKTKYKAGKIISFVGKPGTGKDHLACAICNDILAEKPEFKIEHFAIYEISRLLVKSENQQSDINRLSYCDLLIINEIGVQFVNQFEKQILFEIVNNIYRNEGNCILISNTTPDDFKKMIDFDGYNRVYDRIRSYIVFDWESKRTVKKAD